jgi:hypothetical protein
MDMNFQRIYDKSENAAVAVAVALFMLFHFGMLVLFNLV